jgi:hypothetical protein
MARGETLITACRILEVTDRGFILMVGTELLAVEDTPETRWWLKGAQADRKGFAKDAQVHVRIKTDADPPILREMADAGTWKWLEETRKEFRKGVIDKVDAKFLHVKFADGSSFSYRLTEKSPLKLANKAAATISDLSPGLTIWVKGRLLPTLDTWAAEVRDTPPAEPAAKKNTKGSSAAPTKQIASKPIPTSGKLETIVQGHYPQLKMFDVIFDNRTLHITYNADTKWTYSGKAGRPEQLTKNLEAVITYRRDKSGRIIASKVELSVRIVKAGPN